MRRPAATFVLLVLTCLAARAQVGSGDLLNPLPISRIGGGWSDRVIEDVHQTLNIANGNREAFRRNSETVYLQSATTLYIRNRSAGFALGDIAISSKYELKSLEGRDVSMAVT